MVNLRAFYCFSDSHWLHVECDNGRERRRVSYPTLVCLVIPFSDYQSRLRVSTLLQVCKHTRRWLFRQDSRTCSRFSPPSHSLLFVGRTRRITQYTASGMRRIKTNSALPDRCSWRFRCAKNNIQLFLWWYNIPKIQIFIPFVIFIGIIMLFFCYKCVDIIPEKWYNVLCNIAFCRGGNSNGIY